MSMSLTYGVQKLEYEDLNREIKRTMHRSAKDVVQLGFLLRQMMEKKMWEEVYDCFDEYLTKELHMDYSLATRFMNINRKYSVSGDSMEIAAEYEEYSQGLLIEMLNMPPELEKKVTSDMTVKQVREIKKQAKAEQEIDDNIPGQTSIETDFPECIPKEKVADLKEDKCKPDLRGLMDNPYCKTCGTPLREYAERCSSCGQLQDWEGYDQDIDPDAEEIIDGDYREIEVPDSEEENIATSQPEEYQQEEKLSPYGLSKMVYPEGSLITTEGCSNLHSCFSCAQECAIRQKNRYCVEAPLGNPFSCTTMQVLKNIRSEIGEQCQFINLDIPEHTAGTNEPDPCCKNCNNGSCGYRCRRAMESYNPETEDSNVESEDEYVPEGRLQVLKYLLDQKKGSLNFYSKAGCLSETDIRRDRSIVEALSAMVRDLEDIDPASEPEEITQPELPAFKNNDQRKEWLANYKSWGLWYRDGNIDVNYYKYDFIDGSCLVVAEYPQRLTYYSSEYKDEHYYHLLEKNKKGYKKPYDEQYRQQPDSETYLVEFLKNLQKKG